jgi:hypothetical protein
MGGPPPSPRLSGWILDFDHRCLSGDRNTSHNKPDVGQPEAEVLVPSI